MDSLGEDSFYKDAEIFGLSSIFFAQYPVACSSFSCTVSEMYI
jgi:hypothetical protein